MSYKDKRKLVDVLCDQCGTIHQKPETEYNRNKELGRKNYCSRSCCGKATINTKIPMEIRKWDHLKGYSNADEFSEFRVYLRRTKKRNHEVDLTLQDLKDLWEKQDGLCPYSGVKLIKPSDKRRNNPIHTASLDRIDSCKGYTKDNVQFVSIAINLMKQTMSHEDTIDLCKKIAEKWKDKL